MADSMTVIVGLVDPASNTVCLAADSRITAAGPGSEHHYDVCQKVARLGNQGLFGISGSLETAGWVSRWITGTYRNLGVGWLGSESDVRAFLKELGVLGLNGDEGASFLVAYMDNHEGRGEGTDAVPRATLVSFSTEGRFERTRLGIQMIGEGSEALEPVRQRLATYLNIGIGQRGVASAHRIFLLAEDVLHECRIRSISSVGGLMQLYFVEDAGVRAIPYRRWVDIGSSHGTYVNMAIDADGAWVQEHEETGLRVPLRFPGESDFRTASGGSVNFQLERDLSLDSPGVVLRPLAVTAFSPMKSESGGWIVGV